MSLTASKPSSAEPATTPAIPVREFFTLDVRSLALFRVAVAVMIFLDWVDRLPFVRVLYSDEGILPRRIVQGIQPFSVHMLTGSVWGEGALFVVGMLFAVLLLVGWRTPWVTLINFFLLASIHARTPPVMTGGDHVLRIVTFWGIFLPLGACWSIDAARSKTKPSPNVLSPATVAYLLQIVVIYFFAAAWKWLGPWREEGTAVYLALSIDHLPTRLGLVLREFPDVCKLLTHATIWLETLGPVVLFLPFHVGFQRLVTVMTFILFHAGLALCLELGHFPFVCMVAWLPLLPGSLWDRILPRLAAADAGDYRLVYDPERSRAARWLAYLRTFLFLDAIDQSPAHEEEGQLSRARKHGGFLLLDRDGKELAKGEALRTLFAMSPVWFPFARLVGDRCAAVLVGPVRPGQRETPRPAGPPAWTPPGGWIANTLVIFFFFTIVLTNGVHFVATKLRDLDPERAKQVLPLVPDSVFQLPAALGIDQGWGLFAPEPGRRFGWHLVIGTRKDGTRVNVLTGEPFEGVNKPPFITVTHWSSRWRKLMMNLPEAPMYPYLLPGFTKFQFEEWNRVHPDDHVAMVQVFWMKEMTVGPGETPPPGERVLLYTYLPRPADEPAGWLLVVGTQKNGKAIDLMRGGGEASYDKPDPAKDPPVVNPWFGVLVTAATADADKILMPAFAKYLLTTWNARPETTPDERLTRVQIWRMTEKPGQPAERESLAEAEEKR